MGVDTSGGGVGQPATYCSGITPSDDAELARYSRAIYIGGDGDLTVMCLEGQIETFVGLSAGTVLPIRAKKVYLTGTTATNLVNLA